MSNAIWLIQLASTWSLFGLIWVIQLVHYPSFRYVPDFVDFHPHHTTSITYIVGPLMLTELAITTFQAYRSGWDWMWITPLATVVLIWLLTFFIAIPLHESLAIQRTDETIDSLVRANWPRTALWTFKAAWISWLFAGR